MYMQRQRLFSATQCIFVFAQITWSAVTASCDPRRQCTEEKKKWTGCQSVSGGATAQTLPTLTVGLTQDDLTVRVPALKVYFHFFVCLLFNYTSENVNIITGHFVETDQII